MKILDISNMLDAAMESDMPEIDMHIGELEVAAHRLAEALAAHLGVRALEHGTYYEFGFGGLCSSFAPWRAGQPCPEVIENGDPVGDWELPS